MLAVENNNACYFEPELIPSLCATGVASSVWMYSRFLWVQAGLVMKAQWCKGFSPVPPRHPGPGTWTAGPDMSLQSQRWPNFDQIGKSQQNWDRIWARCPGVLIGRRADWHVEGISSNLDAGGLEVQEELLVGNSVSKQSHKWEL